MATTTPTNPATPSQSLLVAPPRTTGDPQQDLALIVNWMYLLYQILQVNGTFVTAASQVTANTFNPTTLPDPANTNLANAQQTANNAYALASQAETAATAAQADATTSLNKTKHWVVGQLTISGTATSATHTFSGAEAQTDTAYKIIASASAQSGAPAAGSSTLLTVTKNTAGFALNIATAPGGGNAVTFDFILTR